MQQGTKSTKSAGAIRVQKMLSYPYTPACALGQRKRQAAKAHNSNIQYTLCDINIKLWHRALCSTLLRAVPGYLKTIIQHGAQQTLLHPSAINMSQHFPKKFQEKKVLLVGRSAGARLQASAEGSGKSNGWRAEKPLRWPFLARRRPWLLVPPPSCGPAQHSSSIQARGMAEP